MMNSDYFLHLSHMHFNLSISTSPELNLRRFKALFGVSPDICCLIYENLVDVWPNGGQVKHILYALGFLKRYDTDDARRCLLGEDKKTIHKWTMEMVQLISQMDIVSIK